MKHTHDFASPFLNFIRYLSGNRKEQVQKERNYNTANQLGFDSHEEAIAEFKAMEEEWAKEEAWEAEQVEPTIKVDDWIYHRPTSQAGQVVGLADQDNNIRVQFDDGVGVVSAFDVDIEHHELQPAEVSTPDRKRIFAGCENSLKKSLLPWKKSLIR